LIFRKQEWSWQIRVEFTYFEPAQVDRMPEPTTNFPTVAIATIWGEGDLAFRQMSECREAVAGFHIPRPSSAVN
jgi:hypothetical protein